MYCIGLISIAYSYTWQFASTLREVGHFHLLDYGHNPDRNYGCDMKGKPSSNLPPSIFQTKIDIFEPNLLTYLKICEHGKGEPIGEHLLDYCFSASQHELWVLVGRCRKYKASE